jgi:hypothetical protein
MGYNFGMPQQNPAQAIFSLLSGMMGGGGQMGGYPMGMQMGMGMSPEALQGQMIFNQFLQRAQGNKAMDQVKAQTMQLPLPPKLTRKYDCPICNSLEVHVSKMRKVELEDGQRGICCLNCSVDLIEAKKLKRENVGPMPKPEGNVSAEAKLKRMLERLQQQIHQGDKDLLGVFSGFTADVQQGLTTEEKQEIAEMKGQMTGIEAQLGGIAKLLGKLFDKDGNPIVGGE